MEMALNSRPWASPFTRQHKSIVKVLRKVSNRQDLKVASGHVSNWPLNETRETLFDLSLHSFPTLIRKLHPSFNKIESESTGIEIDPLLSAYRVMGKSTVRLNNSFVTRNKAPFKSTSPGLDYVLCFGNLSTVFSMTIPCHR